MADSVSAILNNEFNLFGRKTYLIRMVSKYFPVIDDAPVEKQGSWVKNLVTGLVVTAALAACAVFVVATGGLGLGAVVLIGAAVGAGAVTTVVAVNDHKSGQARSYGEFLQLLDKGIKIGACAGAVVYGGWTLVATGPEIGAAATKMVTTWGGKMTSTQTVSLMVGGRTVVENQTFFMQAFEKIANWMPIDVEVLAVAIVGTVAWNLRPTYDSNGIFWGISISNITSKEATKAAEELGYKKTNEKSHGQPVYKNSKGKPKYITPDADAHNGGVWKGANSVKNLGQRKTRLGTYDGSLNRIGD